MCGSCSSKQFPLLVTFAPLVSEVHRVCDGCYNALAAFIDAASRPAAIATSASGGPAVRGSISSSASGSASAGFSAGAGAGVGAGAGAGTGGGARRTSAAAGTSELQTTMQQTRVALGERGEKLNDIGTVWLGCPMRGWWVVVANRQSTTRGVCVSMAGQR